METTKNGTNGSAKNLGPGVAGLLGAVVSWLLSELAEPIREMVQVAVRAELEAAILGRGSLDVLLTDKVKAHLELGTFDEERMRGVVVSELRNQLDTRGSTTRVQLAGFMAEQVASRDSDVRDNVKDIARDVAGDLWDERADDREEDFSDRVRRVVKDMDFTATIEVE